MSTMRGKAHPVIRLRAGASVETLKSKLKKMPTRRMETFKSTKGSFTKIRELPSISSDDDLWSSSADD